MFPSVTDRIHKDASKEVRRRSLFNESTTRTPSTSRFTDRMPTMLTNLSDTSKVNTNLSDTSKREQLIVNS